MTLRLRKRHRLRKKEIKKLVGQIEDTLCSEFDVGSGTIDRASGPEFDVLFVDGEIDAIVQDEEVFPTIRGLLKMDGAKRSVTVDMGAIKFVANGADVMSPGIVDADLGIKEGDLVWIQDENNHRPLSIGRALLSGPEMVESKTGKGVKTIHYVGDPLWNYEG